MQTQLTPREKHRRKNMKRLQTWINGRHMTVDSTGNEDSPEIRVIERWLA